MLILAIDTALKSCSVALVEDGATRIARRLALEKGHAERLAPMAREALADSGVQVGSIDRIAVVVGPGGFAGVRVGVAFARGLALGGKARTVGVTSLAALAGGASPGDAPVVAAIDARRGQVYAALFDPRGGERLAPFVAAPEDARRRLASAGAAGALLVGDGGPLIDPQADLFRRVEGRDDIDPVVVARLGAMAMIAGPARPLYLRPPDAVPVGGASLS